MSNPAPPPKEADDRLVTGVITAAWAVALVVLLFLRDSLPPDSRWWVWTCVAGLVMGLFGLWYVPLLKRGRARAATSRQPSPPDSGYVSRDSGSNTVSSTETPGSSTRS
jgi:H+/Cl- antiporter ClcA